jgi:hypothetical protein
MSADKLRPVESTTTPPSRMSPSITTERRSKFLPSTNSVVWSADTIAAVMTGRTGWSVRAETWSADAVTRHVTTSAVVAFLERGMASSLFVLLQG